jgi:hypothetical protein
MRHAIGAQRIELGKPELQGMKAEKIGDHLIYVTLFPFQQIAADRGLKPLGQTYNRAAFSHEPDRSPRRRRPIHRMPDRSRAAVKPDAVQPSVRAADDAAEPWPAAILVNRGDADAGRGHEPPSFTGLAGLLATAAKPIGKTPIR